MFWLFVVCSGLVGAIADVLLSQWSRTDKLWWLLAGAVGYLLFLVLLGLAIRFGTPKGYMLTVVVTLVVVLNICLVAAADIYTGAAASASALQWLGVTLILAGVACVQLGRT